MSIAEENIQTLKKYFNLVEVIPKYSKKEGKIIWIRKSDKKRASMKSSPEK